MLTVGIRPTDFKFSFDLIDEGIDTVVQCHIINDLFEPILVEVEVFDDVCQ